MVAILRKVRKVFDKKTSIEYSKIIDEETQNKILKIARISEYFEGAVNGYYIKIEYSKNTESIVKIIKAI